MLDDAGASAARGVQRMKLFDPNVDYYAILQVHPNAHPEVIKRAYHTVIGLLQAHPDLGGSHEDAVQVNCAYEVLSNPELRKAYDSARNTTPMPARTGALPRVTFRYCPRCGARNRVPVTADLRRAICGKCRMPLSGPQSHNADLPAGANVTPAHLLPRLVNAGEVRLRRGTLPADRQLRCLHCGFTWIELGKAPPPVCPHCRSRRWADFRVFYCRWCRHQFSVSSLSGWPYKLYPACPACHRQHWHRGCERHPLRWLLNLIHR